MDLVGKLPLSATDIAAELPLSATVYLKEIT